jgi:tetratricopeptide (TPR) repeat protein
MIKSKARVVIGVLLLLPVCIIWANSQEMFDRANELLQTQRYSDALTAYERFIYENPDHHLVPAAKWSMANIYFTIRNDYARASSIFQDIISKHPDTGWEILSHDRLGRCFEEQEKWSDAVQVYESALVRLTAESHRELVEEWTGIFKTRLLGAYRNMDDRENMIRIYQGSLTNNPAGPSAPNDHFDLGLVYLEMNEVKKAAQNFAVLVDRYPFSNSARRVQAEYADLLTTELDYDWEPFTLFQSCVRFSQTGHYEEALAGFDEVMALKKNTAMAYAVRFQKELIEFRKNGDAEDLRDKLVASRDEYPYGFGGVRTVQLLDLLDRIIEAKAATNTNPEDVGAYTGLAFAYYQVQAYYPGIETYKKAISIAPDNGGLHNMLGYCYIGVEAYDDAIATLQQLIDMSPEDPNSYDSMAEAHYVKGDTTMAIQYYQQSLAVDSTFTNPYYMLGEIYHGLEDDEMAKVHLERYLELDPEGFRAQGALGLLAQINEEQ